MPMKTSTPRQPTLLESLIPIVFLILLLGFCVVDVTSMPRIAILTPILEALATIPLVGNLLQMEIDPHLPLIAGAAVAGLIGWRLGFTWKVMEEGMIGGIVVALTAIVILLLVGILIGTWILSGIVPTMVYYGLALLSPGIFLVAACVICALVSLATGSSWSTAGTVGVALIGVGQGLGLPLPLVAGAIVSGAYFGDKMSPLSDTTNLASGVVGTSLFEHIRHMMWSSGPSLLLALLVYGVIGLFYRGGTASNELEVLITALPEQFTISGWLLLPPLFIAVVVARQLPAIPALVGASAIGGLLALLFQGASLGDVFSAGFSGYVSETGNAAVDDLLSRGGLESMLSTVALIICALTFGGIMERTGMLGVLAGAILRAASSTGSLVAATLATAVGVNIVAPDQYLSLVVTGRMYREAYEQAELDPKNLSRCLEDGGTMSSPLIPWNTCGAFMWATLGVFPLAYLPFAFFNLFSPMFSLLYGFTGWTMVKIDTDNHPESGEISVGETAEEVVKS